MARVLTTEGYIAMSEIATPATPVAGEAKLFIPTSTVPTIGIIDDAGVVAKIALASATTFNYTPPTSWTMAVSFGGGTTGITYGTRTTRYQRIGDMVFAYGYMELTAKGSSTGSALITGLPVAAVGTAGLITSVTIRADLLTGITGMVMGYIAPSATTIVLQFLGTGTATTMTDAHFTNTTNFSIMAAYQVA